VDQKEIAGIEGFDEETARELQSRAREYLEKLEAEQDAERQALGVEDGLKEIPGVTTAMLVALGKGVIKTVEDFAGAVPDDLTGYVERKDGEAKRIPGALESFGLSRADAEAMIMQARIKAGWVTEEDLRQPEPEAEAAEEAAPAPVA
jgi:N utilization substance protein A